MNKILTLCLLGALALTASSCKDEQTITVQTITVNGQIWEVKSALYAEEPADYEDEPAIALGLFPTTLSTFPTEEPEFYIGIEISESLLGKTLDLTKPLDQTKVPAPYLYIGAVNNDQELDIEYYDNLIDVTDNATVTSGKLTVTRNGDKFSVKLYVELSDESWASADWKGTATKIRIP